MLEEISKVSYQQLHSFLRPKSIALVGATDNSRWSVATFENLKRFEFSGPIYLVNPNRTVVHGEQAYKSLSQVPEPVELAFIMVSTQHVLSVVKEAAGLGTKNFVVLTSGFSEAGAEGQRLERELLTLAKAQNLILLGPNGNGFINLTDNITPYGLRVVPPLKSGPVGVVLQSGALASAVLTFAQAHSIGLSLLVSMGNESMLSVTDVVDYLLEDDSTRVIALFLESIRYPEELRRLALKAREKRKPIVVLKIGKSSASARTAFSHTGALVGNDDINDAAFRQLDIIRVNSLEDLLITAGLAGYAGILPGRRMGVVTPSGGACDILSDLAEQEGIVLPEFDKQTVTKLVDILPPFSTAHNPLDVTGYVVVDNTLQMRALEVVAGDPNIDFILYLSSIESARELEPVALASIYDQYDRLTDTIRASTHPVILVSNSCVDLTPIGHSIVEKTNLHFIGGMEHGIKAISRLLWWSEKMNSTSTNEPDADYQLAQLPTFTQTFTGNWTEAHARKLLQEGGIPVVPGILTTNAQEAVQAAQHLGFPVALKIQSPEIQHKSDVGGVILNLGSAAEVSESFARMLGQVGQKRLDAEIEGVLVSPMRQGGTELLVSVIRDNLWGLVLTIGLGGIWTEALNDTAVRILPITLSEIKLMLSELRGYVLLQGGRGQARVNLAALSEVIFNISKLSYAIGPQLNTLEINPLWVGPSHIEVLDVLLSWQHESLH